MFDTNKITYRVFREEKPVTSFRASSDEVFAALILQLYNEFGIVPVFPNWDVELRSRGSAYLSDSGVCIRITMIPGGFRLSIPLE